MGDAWRDGEGPTALQVQNTTVSTEDNYLLLALHLSREHREERRADRGEHEKDETLWEDTWWSGDILSTYPLNPFCGVLPLLHLPGEEQRSSRAQAAQGQHPAE